MPILELQGVTKTFGGLTAVNELSFEVQKGDILGLIGPNGAGKTTVFNLITRHLNCTGGKVIFQGHDITNVRMDKIISFGIARTFQGSRIFRNLTVLEAMLTACYSKRKTGLILDLLNSARAKNEMQQHTEHAIEILKFIGLEERKNDQAGNLPYAHQSLVGIGMALVAEPQLLLLDEPIAGMNPQETLETMELIRKINGRGITVLLVEHNMTAVMGVCNRIVVMNYGEKIVEGTPGEIMEHPAVIDAYLGSGFDARAS